MASIKFDPQFTPEQNRAYGLMLIREGFEQLTKERREKALSLIEWHDTKGFLSDKQWDYVLSLASFVSADKLSLNFATDPDVKPALAAIVEKADKIIDFVHAKDKAAMGHFIGGLDKAKQFAAAYGMGKTKLAAVAMDPPASWIDNEIAAITAMDAAPKKKGLSWAKALAKTPAGKPVQLGLDYAKGEGWSTLGDVASGLDLTNLKPLDTNVLQSTAMNGKAMTIAEAKTLLLHVADEDSIVATMAKHGIKDKGGINAVLVKAGLDPKLPPGDALDHAAIKGDLVTYYGSSHLFSLKLDDLKVLTKDHGAFIATETDWHPEDGLKAMSDLKTIEEATDEALAHYPPHGVSPWQAKQGLLMMASGEPVLQSIGFKLQETVGDFHGLLYAAKIAGLDLPAGWKATTATLNAAWGQMDFSEAGLGCTLKLDDLKSKRWIKTAGGQLPYTENSHIFGHVEPSAEFPMSLMTLNDGAAKHVLLALTDPDPQVIAQAWGTINKAGGINKVLAYAEADVVIPVHEMLFVEKDYVHHKFNFHAKVSGAVHTYALPMDHLHDIKPVLMPPMKPVASAQAKPVFFTGKPKLEAKKAWDKQTGQLVTVLDLDGLKEKTAWSQTDAFEVHVDCAKNPTSVMCVLFEKLFKKWDVVTCEIGPHKIAVTFPMGSIDPSNVGQLKALCYVAEGYANAPLETIMDDWNSLDAGNPTVHVNTPTSGAVSGSWKHSDVAKTKTVIVHTTKTKPKTALKLKKPASN